MEFTGEFETHITVGLDSDDQVESLNRWGINHDLKCLHIVLERGATASQPMLTRHGQGTLTGELKKAVALAESLQVAGLPVLRIKIEVAASNQGVLHITTGALNYPPEYYFEHHIKLRLDSRADLSPLAKLAEQHTAHLSHNAFIHPQGKDLYDATLLAEQTHLPLDLLYKVLRAGGWQSQAELQPDFPLKWKVDWANFKLEYPGVKGKAEEWQPRLAHALAPTFATTDATHR